MSKAEELAEKEAELASLVAINNRNQMRINRGRVRRLEDEIAELKKKPARKESRESTGV